MITVYRYREGATACCAAEAPAVLAAFGGRAAFATFFGGDVTFGLPSRPDYLGVWGVRNASRFRRILREAGFGLTMTDTPPPARLTGKSVNYRRLGRAEREAMEGAMPARLIDPAASG